jgi:molybdopterin converting factor small subunit
MQVSVRLFAMLRQQARWDPLVLELPDGAAVEEASERLFRFSVSGASHAGRA